MCNCRHICVSRVSLNLKSEPHSNPLRHAAVLCRTLQCTAGHCSALQHTAAHCTHTAPHCNTLQHTATHCNTLQHTATHCTTLHHTAPHCTTLQHAATYMCEHSVPQRQLAENSEQQQAFPQCALRYTVYKHRHVKNVCKHKHMSRTSLKPNFIWGGYD